MTALGQTRHFDGAPLTSGLPQLADILWGSRHVSKVPIGDIDQGWRFSQRGS
jgi:hypothetical protein